MAFKFQIKIFYSTFGRPSEVLVVDEGTLLSPSALGGVPAGYMPGPEVGEAPGGIHRLFPR